MDAVIFEVKGAHLAAQRAGRELLRELDVGMTPARFDLMNALGRQGMRQSDLWRRLKVVRSAVCEMVRSVLALAWVKRVRAADGRTWLVQLTRRGRDAFERAYAQNVESGKAALQMDAALCRWSVASDALALRSELLYACEALQEGFRTRPWLRRPDLYWWQAGDFCEWLTEPGEDAPEVPFVDSLPDVSSAGGS